MNAKQAEKKRAEQIQISHRMTSVDEVPGAGKQRCRVEQSDST
jgi:hypothetical protein